MKKLFTLLLALVATTALWAQRFKVGDLYYQVVGSDFTEEVLNIPQVAAPAAGQTTVVLNVPEDTPNGCYAVGSFNWDATNTEKMFTPVEGADEGWVSCTFDWTEDLEFKVLAIPSDPDVAPGWSYQWGKNIDPENDLTEDNVVILDGSVGGEFVLEGQGEPKLVGLADGGVCYIHVKAWANTPIIKPVPCETAAFKHPWNGGDWVYRDAVKTAEATFELNALFGNSGILVAFDVNGFGENWYPSDQIEFVGDVAQGDSVNIKFVSEKLAIGKLTVTLIEKATPIDQPEAKDITVKAKVPAEWTNTITAWVWPTGGGDGQEVVPTKEGDWYVYTHHCAELNIIFKNGEGWTGDANQTVDITGIQENTCLVLESDGATKATYTNVDCDDPWYTPAKKNRPVSRKNTSSDEEHYVVVTSEKTDYWFDNYSKLTTAVIPETVVYRGTVYKVIGIEDFAFRGCSCLTSVSIGNSVTSIGYRAFEGCSGLTSITIPNSVTSIGAGAFEDCSSLTSVTIPNSVTEIGFRVFYGCSSLTMPVYNAHCFAYMPTSYEGAYTIPEGIKQIAGGAFDGCSSLTSVTIPNSVTSIGDQAFYYCKSLTSVTIGNSVTSIGSNAFSTCYSLTSVTIPNSVTSIGNYAFSDCDALTSITIPNSVTSIGEGAFSGCDGLTYLSIPNSVIFSEEYYTDSSTGEIIYYYNHGYRTIERCYNLKTLIAPASFFGVGSNSEGDYQYSKEKYLPYLPEKLETLVLNDEELPRFGWDFIERNRKTLHTIDLAATTSTTIPTEIFRNYYNLETLVLPSQLEKIPYLAVAECIKLKAITIPATVTEIEDRAFEDCRSLKSIIFEGEGSSSAPAHRAAAEGSALWRIGSWAFYNCHQLEHLTIPEGVTEVGDAAFYGCSYLEDMTLPSTVQEIGDNTFALCAKVKMIHVKAMTPPAIKAKTFFDVNRRIPVYVPDEVVEAYKSDPYWSEFDIQGESNKPSTALENTHSPSPMANRQKLLLNGQLIILRDGKSYSVMGQEL